MVDVIGGNVFNSMEKYLFKIILFVFKSFEVWGIIFMFFFSEENVEKKIVF